MTPFGIEYRDTMGWSRSRRSLLKSAAAGVLGMSLGEMLSVEASAIAGRRGQVAKNVLVVLEQGGMSHIDTWDPKPQAAAVASYGSAGVLQIPGTVVLVGVFFLSFILYYYVNWKYLSEVWPLR